MLQRYLFYGSFDKAACCFTASKRWTHPFSYPQCPEDILITKPDGSYPPYEQAWQQQFLDSIRTIRPKFFVTAFGPTPAENEFLPDVPYRALEKVAGYNEMLSSNYSLDTTIGWWLVYRVKPIEVH